MRPDVVFRPLRVYDKLSLCETARQARRCVSRPLDDARKGTNMPAKRSPSAFPRKQRRPKRPRPRYSSLAQGPAPSERRKEVETRMRQRGLTPIDDFDRYFAEVTDFWPEDESCDEFLACSANCGARGNPDGHRGCRHRRRLLPIQKRHARSPLQATPARAATADRIHDVSGTVCLSARTPLGHCPTGRTGASPGAVRSLLRR